MKRLGIVSAVLSTLLVLAGLPLVANNSALAATGDVEINETNFPDLNFRSYVLTTCDSNGDSILSSDEINSRTQMFVDKSSIANLTGIEFFTSLTVLDCSYNELTSLDLSGNTSLSSLLCNNNQLQSLNIRNNSNLVFLQCCNNELTSLDIGNNPKLNQLMGQNNRITELNISNNTELNRLWVWSNPITSLNISNSPNLLAAYQNGENTTGRIPAFSDTSVYYTAPVVFGEFCTERTATIFTEPTITMYRLYNPNSGEHFYTSNEAERNTLIGLGWNDEDIGWIAPSTSNTPVYRLYNENAGEHHYTMSIGERDALVEAGWKYEGIGWYSDDSQRVPLYRQYNPNAYANNHNYTTSLRENDDLVSLGWQAEGIGWYGIG